MQKPTESLENNEPPPTTITQSACDNFRIKDDDESAPFPFYFWEIEIFKTLFEINLSFFFAVANAEIYWALNIVMKHQTYNSSDTMSELFPVKFPDSCIAKEIAIKRTKLQYMIV